MIFITITLNEVEGSYNFFEFIIFLHSIVNITSNSGSETAAITTTRGVSTLNASKNIRLRSYASSMSASVCHMTISNSLMINLQIFCEDTQQNSSCASLSARSREPMRRGKGNIGLLLFFSYSLYRR